MAVDCVEEKKFTFFFFFPPLQAVYRAQEDSNASFLPSFGHLSRLLLLLLSTSCLKFKIPALMQCIFQRPGFGSLCHKDIVASAIVSRFVFCIFVGRPFLFGLRCVASTV